MRSLGPTRLFSVVKGNGEIKSRARPPYTSAGDNDDFCEKPENTPLVCILFFNPFNNHVRLLLLFRSPGNSKQPNIFY